MSILPEPRGDPVVSPNALQPVANFTNNNTSVWALNGAGGGVSGVSQIVAGTGISVLPSGGTGVVTVSATVPISSNNTYYSTVNLPAGINSTVDFLDTSDPVKFPPNSSWYFTLNRSGFGTYGCDTTSGQLTATGVFHIGPNNQYTSITAGSSVNTATANTNNPTDFGITQVTSTAGLNLYTSSLVDFTGCSFIFTYSQILPA